MKLPKLLNGWVWRPHSPSGEMAACLFTLEQDYFVWAGGGAIHVSAGVAPVEVVEAVVKVAKKGGER